MKQKNVQEKQKKNYENWKETQQVRHRDVIHKVITTTWPGAKAPGHNLYKLFVIFGRSPAIIKDRLLIQSPSSFIYDTFVIHLYQLDDVII